MSTTTKSKGTKLGTFNAIKVADWLRAHWTEIQEHPTTRQDASARIAQEMGVKMGANTLTNLLEAMGLQWPDVPRSARAPSNKRGVAWCVAAIEKIAADLQIQLD